MIARGRPRLSQHFLHDRSVASRIAEAVGARPAAHVLEVGPGEGALTEHLLAHGWHVTAIEIDPAMATAIRSKFGASDRLTVVESDVLEFRLPGLAEGESWYVAGNLPYAITTPILFHFLDQIASAPIADHVFMVQREVAERIVADPGGRTIGALTVSIGLVADVEILFDVGPGAFRPAPTVWSTVFRMTPHDRWGLDPERLSRVRRLVRGAFIHRRKQLQKSLRMIPGLSVCDRDLATAGEAAGIDLTRRPETLEIEEWLALEARIQRFGGGG